MPLFKGGDRRHKLVGNNIPRGNTELNSPFQGHLDYASPVSENNYIILFSSLENELLPIYVFYFTF